MSPRVTLTTAIAVVLIGPALVGCSDQGSTRLKKAQHVQEQLQLAGTYRLVGSSTEVTGDGSTAVRAYFGDRAAGTTVNPLAAASVDWMPGFKQSSPGNKGIAWGHDRKTKCAVLVSDDKPDGFAVPGLDLGQADIDRITAGTAILIDVYVTCPG